MCIRIVRCSLISYSCQEFGCSQIPELRPFQIYRCPLQNVANWRRAFNVSRHMAYALAQWCDVHVVALVHVKLLSKEGERQNTIGASSEYLKCVSESHGGASLNIAGVSQNHARIRTTGVGWNTTGKNRCPWSCVEVGRNSKENESSQSLTLVNPSRIKQFISHVGEWKHSRSVKFPQR